MTSGAATAVLIVESDWLVRAVTAVRIKDTGYVPLLASDADQALRILEFTPAIKLVIAGSQLPGALDGVELLHLIRGRWPLLHLVVVSSDGELAAGTLPHGAQVCEKPASDIALAKLLRRLLGSSDDK